MLTQEDFSKLKRLVRDEVEAEGKNTRDELSYDIKTVRIELSNRIDTVGSRVKNLEIATNNLQKDMTTVKKDVKKLQKNVDGVINMADRGLLNTQKRVRIIETTLKIPSPDFV